MEKSRSSWWALLWSYRLPLRLEKPMKSDAVFCGSAARKPIVEPVRVRSASVSAPERPQPVAVARTILRSDESATPMWLFHAHISEGSSLPLAMGLAVAVAMARGALPT